METTTKTIIQYHGNLEVILDNGYMLFREESNDCLSLLKLFIHSDILEYGQYICFLRF